VASGGRKIENPTLKQKKPSSREEVKKKKKKGWKEDESDWLNGEKNGTRKKRDTIFLEKKG